MVNDPHLEHWLDDIDQLIIAREAQLSRLEYHAGQLIGRGALRSSIVEALARTQTALARLTAKRLAVVGRASSAVK